MPEKEPPEEIKVSDRRQFTRDGRRIDPGPEPAQVPGAESARAEDVPAGASFEGLIMGLVGAALIHLGQVPGAGGAPGGVNLPAAREAIDLLGILHEKTSGNLTAQEKNLLEYWLFRLRMEFSEKVRPS
jgi:hypothetical protein